MSPTETLLSISNAILATPADNGAICRLPEGCKMLAELLGVKNGLYAFESALHMFPLGREEGVMDLEQWNSPELWRCYYDNLTDGMFFFAEDIFGGQFYCKDGGIGYFDPELAEVEHLAGSLGEWAEMILENYNYRTGYPLAHEWQKIHGRIPDGHRLMPFTLFVLGGEYEIANLRMVDSVWGMRARGPIAQQIRNLPDGTTIEFEIVE